MVQIASQHRLLILGSHLIEIETSLKPSVSVIWLHGLGASGDDFVPIIPELTLPVGAGIRFIFPSAPVMPVTINGGYVMPAWYDILSLDEHSRVVDQAGIVQSCRFVHDLIAREHTRGIASSHILIAGFSQGGAITYTAGLTYPEALGGLITLSTYLPEPQLVELGLPDISGHRKPSSANQYTPIFAGHGTHDDVVSVRLGEAARSFCQRHGNDISWHTYPIEHTLSLQEIDDLSRWLSQRYQEITAAS